VRRPRASPSRLLHYFSTGSVVMDINLERLTVSERGELEQLLASYVWFPHPANKPQVNGFFCPAFETLYGGAAGGGKSDLLLGLARTMHTRSLLLRRTFPDLERSLISRSMEFYGDPKHYNGGKHVWNVDGRRIEFGHMEHVGTPQIPGDESMYASAPYDFIGFDQLEQFPQYAYEFLLSRARSTVIGQRVRVGASANPVGEGITWIMNRWRAWLLDKTAKPAEILYYKRDEEGNDVLTDVNDPDGLSRTFIPAGLKDNPYLGDEYRRTLSNLPEPLRSALLDGDWGASITDDAYQVLPRSWVRAAQMRWHPSNAIPDVVGVDVARGGDDKTVFAPRSGDYYFPLHKHRGVDTPDSDAVLAFLVADGLPLKGAKYNVDVIGIGASVYDAGRKVEYEMIPINFGAGSDSTDKSGTLHFVNLRAEVYWAFREALDPKSGRNVVLPPDDELEADLCAARWTPQSNGIKIEAKEEIKKRIGRSPDCADAIVLSNYGGASLDWSGFDGLGKVTDLERIWR
jgi:hypothetical protein